MLRHREWGTYFQTGADAGRAGAHPEDLVCNIANVLHDIVTFHSNFCLYPCNISQIENYTYLVS